MRTWGRGGPPACSTVWMPSLQELLLDEGSHPSQGYRDAIPLPSRGDLFERPPEL